MKRDEGALEPLLASGATVLELARKSNAEPV
jgi:hypothetical protein